MRNFKTTRMALAATLALATVGLARTGYAAESEAQLITEAQHTMDLYRKADPGIDEFFRRSVGYVVFPGIGKGGLGIGGAHGNGVLFERGAPVGKVTMNQVTIGAQAGGQEFSQIVFFEVPKALNDLKASKASLRRSCAGSALWSMMRTPSSSSSCLGTRWSSGSLQVKLSATRPSHVRTRHGRVHCLQMTM